MKKLRIMVLILFFMPNSQAWGQDYAISASIGRSGLQSGSTQVLSVMGVRFLDVSLFRAGGGLRFTNWQRSSELGFDSTYKLSELSVSALNIVILAEADIFNDFVLGFNIDAFGVSFGEEVDLVGPPLDAKPETTNILLGGKPDRGSLNSEFYVGVKYHHLRWATGLSHQVTEYKAVDEPTGKLQRFFDTAFLRVDYFF